MKVIALVPAYQEAARIASVVNGVRRQLPVLVIDDGSTDGTAERARGAGADVIVQSQNAGKGTALRAGFREVLARGADAALTLDADGQHDPADIRGFLAAHERQPADLIVGRRDFRAMPPLRRLSNMIGRRVVSWAVGRDIPDNQSGYRLVGRRVMEAVLDSREPGFEFELEMIAICVADGYSLAWTPIRTIYAGAPSHIRPVHHVRSFIRASRAARARVRAVRRG
jgi:glycosyltransferase involved in cell wall biosynthesis